jgi:ATP-dependent DNA helicase RecG
MTLTDLLEMIRNGESSSVEFKRDDIEPRKFAREVVAFANSFGGRVLLGVEDDGSVTGVTRDHVEEWVMTACRDKVRPELVPHFEMVRDVEPGKHVAVATIERSYTVHALWHDQHRTWLIRVGTENREANEEELGRLLQRRGALRLDLRPVPGTSIEVLDRRRLRDYFVRVRGQEVPDDADVDAWRNLLVNTELMTTEGERADATVAAVLLFGRTPNRYLPQSGIDAVAYPGTEKDYAAIERAPLRGPMLPLYDASGANIVENGLVEQALAFVARNTTSAATILPGGVRQDLPFYPVEVVREAVVNALVHRDYILAGTDIELSLYADRLEIVSPGRLPNGITEARMRTGCRASRNELIKDVMRDYRYIEHAGMGVPRKIVKLMGEHNGTDPGLIEDREGERFTVRLVGRAPEHVA